MNNITYAVLHSAKEILPLFTVFLFISMVAAVSFEKASIFISLFVSTCLCMFILMALAIFGG